MYNNLKGGKEEEYLGRVAVKRCETFQVTLFSIFCINAKYE